MNFQNFFSLSRSFNNHWCAEGWWCLGPTPWLCAPKTQSIRLSTEKYYVKGRYLEFVNADETWDKHFIQFRYKIQWRSKASPPFGCLGPLPCRLSLNSQWTWHVHNAIPGSIFMYVFYLFVTVIYLYIYIGYIYF